MTFDFSSNKAVDFHCKLSSQNEDLSGNVTSIGRKTDYCGTASTQGSKLYNKELFQTNGNKAYMLTVYGNDSKDGVSGMSNFSFAVIKGGSSDVGEVGSTTNGFQNSNLDESTRDCNGAIQGDSRQVQARYTIEGHANYPINITTTENQD